jgi:dTDP-4-dehydrorhamnose reductase
LVLLHLKRDRTLFSQIVTSHSIWLLGASGYVGAAYQRLFALQDVAFISIGRADLDYYNEDALVAALREGRPSFLINSAGYTGKPNVDACERARTDCLKGNAVLPGVIRSACEKVNIPWGHVSSGCIYTGRREDGKGFGEDDPPNFSFRTNNSSFYSGTKALGEELLEGAAQTYIWRLRIPFNEIDSPRNYLTKMMCYERLLDAENSLSQLDEFVRATWECWRKRVPFGSYNVTNPGAVTTREVVEMIQQSGVSKKQFSFFDTEDEFMRVAAKTPRSNCVMDSSKLDAAGIHMVDIQDAIRKALRNWQATR